MRARLLGLVLIPATGLALIAGAEVRDQWRLARDARDVAADVDEATAALDAYVATTQEYRLTLIAVVAAEYGLSLEQAGDLLGMDFAAELAAVRQRVSEITLIAALEERVAEPGDLALGRAVLDESSREHPIFADVVIEAEKTWQTRMGSLGDDRAETTVDTDVRRSLYALRTSASLFEIANDELLLVSELMVPGSAVREAASDDLDLLALRYDLALDRAVADRDEHLAEELAPLIEDHGFHDEIEDLGVATGETVDVVELAGLFRSGLARDSAIQELTHAASADARSHALIVGDEAQARYRRTLAVAAALVIATVAMALLVARSISRPLRLLAKRAAEVFDGELDGPPLRLAGPRETVVLARTLTDAVVNLRHVEDRMAALASGDVDRAVHGPVGSGRLGTLVGRSVDGLARSISERDRLQRRLAHEASHDALTGLANRRTALSRIDEMLRNGSDVALLFLDLDGFKEVNDEHGHGVGDELLVTTADRLAAGSPDEALVARLGGDEFVVCAAVKKVPEAVALAHRLAGLVSGPVRLPGGPHRVGVSIGVALARLDDDSDRLLRSADAALREAKRAGRGRVVALDDELRAELDAQHQLEVALRAAIAGDELELHYQPVFHIDGALHGAEALVRWRQPDGTLVPPDEFVPAAERSGSILDLDRWVLTHGLFQLARWINGPFPDICLSVNVSATTLLWEHMVDDVAMALERAGVPGRALMIEVTETSLVHDLTTAAEHIAQLLALGVRTSVDDFGTGYTSVSHLRRLPISEVKIDRSFIQGMGDDDRDRVLVDLMARIGTMLELQVVAEGVETPEQLEAVRSIGCHYVQGYLLGRPVPATELEIGHGQWPRRHLTSVPT